MFSNDRKRTRSDDVAQENEAGSLNPAPVSSTTQSGPLRSRAVNTAQNTHGRSDPASGNCRQLLLAKSGTNATGAQVADSQANSGSGSTCSNSSSSTTPSHIAQGARGKPRRPLRSGLSRSGNVALSSDRRAAVHHSTIGMSTTTASRANHGGLVFKQINSSHPASPAKAPRSSLSDAEAELRMTWKEKREALEEEVRFWEEQSTQLVEETQGVEDAIEEMLSEFEEEKRQVEVHHASTVARYHGLMKALRAREDICLAAKQRALSAIDASVETVGQLSAQQEKTQESIVLATDQRDALARQLTALQATEAERAAFLQQLQAEEERMKDASYGLSGEVRELVLEMERLNVQKRQSEVAAMKTEVARRELYSLCEELKGSIRVYCRVKGSINVDLPAGNEVSNPCGADGITGPLSPARTGRGGSVELSVSTDVLGTAREGGIAISAHLGLSSGGVGAGGLRSGRSTTRSSATTAAAMAADDDDGDAEVDQCLFSFPDRTSVMELNAAAGMDKAAPTAADADANTVTTTTTAVSSAEEQLLSPSDAKPTSFASSSAEDALPSSITSETAEEQVGAEAGLPYGNGRSITIHQTRSNATSTGVSNTEESFTYDRVFPGGAHQDEVYRDVEPLVRNAVDGYRVCVFAYGQTGSGKTFTMEGDLRSTPAAYGVTPRALQTILQRQTELAREGWSYELSCTFIEIYNDVIRDLFQSGSSRYEAAMQQSGNAATYHTIKHVSDRTQITNVSEKRIRTMEEFFALYKQAVDQRSTARTELNDKSSRSHCIFTLYITGTNPTIRQRSEGVLCLVDLAGSERVNESGAQGKQFKEAVNINRSLLDLGKCIRALRSGAVVPWRNCKLTYLLQNYLGAKGGKLLMIVTVSNLRQHAPESINSLRFAARVQETFVGTSVKRVVNLV